MLVLAWSWASHLLGSRAESTRGGTGGSDRQDAIVAWVREGGRERLKMCMGEKKKEEERASERFKLLAQSGGDGSPNWCPRILACRDLVGPTCRGREKEE